MKVYRLHRNQGIGGLELMEQPPSPLGMGQVRIAVRAVALNARDLLIANSASDGPAIVPCSDGAGDIVEIGHGVTGWQIGDRVFPNFYPAWTDGPPTPEVTATGLGGGSQPGMLTEELVIDADSLVAVPAHMSYAEASTLPCAGVTAWNALFGVGRPLPGDSVLLLGTGGVSMWALQLSKAAGLRAIITSSDDDKLAHALSLGADAGINYRKHPQWSLEVRRLTNGNGVDMVVEVGGRGTLGESLSSTRMGGTVALVGGVSGDFGAELPRDGLTEGAQVIAGVRVGSRRNAESLTAFTAVANLRPVIDRTFDFRSAGEAYAHLAAGRHVGKVVVQMG
jgi:NADPH:quinone reductase-like Zn-dependent oxidoreductase